METEAECDEKWLRLGGRIRGNATKDKGSGWGESKTRHVRSDVDHLFEAAQCSQRGSPSVLGKDEDGRHFVVPSRLFLNLPDK